jgi:hypothetical protein
MNLLQTMALIALLQAPCPNCPKADGEALYTAALSRGVPADVLVWAASFEASLQLNKLGKRGEVGPVQVMPRGVNARKCHSFGLDLKSWDCAALVVSDEWRACGGDWVCFWKTHACGSDKTKCGDSVARYREWKRKEVMK